MSSFKTRLILWAVVYTAFFLSLSNVPFLDAPDHLARAVIMKSLWSDPHSRFQGTFSAPRVFMPYLLPDLGMIFLLKTLGVKLAYPVWSALTFLVLAFSILFYARRHLVTPWAL